jgi:hypothetical protein
MAAFAVRVNTYPDRSGIGVNSALVAPRLLPHAHNVCGANIG